MAVAGPTALVATALIAVAGGAPWLVACYLVALQLVTFVGLAGVRSERSRPVDGRAGHGR